MPEQLNPSGSGEAPIVTRRSLFVGAAATLICAPAVVRFVSLMPVRGVHEIERHHYGFVERFYVHANLPTIIKLEDVGLTAHGIAAAMTECGRTSMNGESWDADRVLGVLTRDRNIRQGDAIRRAEGMLGR